MAQRITLEAGSIFIAPQDLVMLRAGKMPEQMYFKAILARRERNGNADEFTQTHLEEVAATIAHTPVDDDHAQHIVQGTILDAAYDPDRKHPRGGQAGALVANCVTWPRRFPDLAQDLVTGVKKLSIESGAEEVECSACHTRYPTTSGETDYCTCLQARRSNGASRLWHKNRGLGAAFTSNPAGTACEVERESLMLVASLSPDPWEDKSEGSEATMDPEKIMALLKAAYEAAVKGEETVSAAKAEPDMQLAKSMLTWAKELVQGVADKAAAAKVAADKALEDARGELVTAQETAIARIKAEADARVTTEKRVAQLGLLPLAVPDPEKRRDLVASLTEDSWKDMLADYTISQKALEAAKSPTPVDPPKTGEELLKGSARETTNTPGTETQGGGTGGTDTKPRSLTEIRLMRAKA